MAESKKRRYLIMPKDRYRKITITQWHSALAFQAFVFPGAGYFVIGRTVRGIIFVIATAYCLIIPLVQFTRTLFHIMVPTDVADTFTPKIYPALELAWAVHSKLIILSLLGIISLWIIGILDIWLKMKQSINSN